MANTHSTTRWTAEDTAFVEATKKKKNAPIKDAYPKILKLHKELPY